MSSSVWIVELLFAFLLIALEEVLHFFWWLFPSRILQKILVYVMFGRKARIVDPRLDMNFVELANSFGYNAEEHFAQTEDGYVLGLHRIPPKDSQRVIGVAFLQHGMMQNSESFICRFKGKALPFILHEAGYDVWLGNNRGNKYSYKHIRLSPKEDAFWDFCIDDFAVSDVPAMVNYVLNATGAKKLFYIGFSQGSAQAFAGFSVNPQLAGKIELFIALAPATLVKTLNNPLVAALTTSRPDILFLLFGKKTLLTFTLYWRNVLASQFFVLAIDYCLVGLFGWNTKQLDPEEKALMYSHIYSFTSVKTLVHWFQITRTKRFQMYDGNHRPVEHRGKYSTYLLPSYQLSKINCKIALFYGGRDTIPEMDFLLNSIPTNSFVHKEDDYEHIDFIWGENAPQRIFSKVVELMNNSIQPRQTLKSNQF